MSLLLCSSTITPGWVSAEYITFERNKRWAVNLPGESGSSSPCLPSWAATPGRGICHSGASQDTGRCWPSAGGQTEPAEPSETAGPQNNNRRQSAVLLHRSLCDVPVMRKVFLQTKASSADRSKSSLNKADRRWAFYGDGVCGAGAAFQIKWWQTRLLYHTEVIAFSLYPFLDTWRQYSKSEQ